MSKGEREIKKDTIQLEEYRFLHYAHPDYHNFDIVDSGPQQLPPHAYIEHTVKLLDHAVYIKHTSS